MSRVSYKILVIMFGLLLALAAVADEVDKSIDASAEGYVEITNTSGTIEVHGWSDNRVQVTGDLGDNVEELVLERDGDRVNVLVKVPRDSNSRIASDIVVRVPQKSSIGVSGVSADINVEGIAGEQDLHTVSGDIQTQAAAADLELGSVGGDIRVEGNGQPIDVDAETVSGDLTLLRVDGEVRAEVVSGDVLVDEGSYQRVSIETVNGDLEFGAGLLRGGRMQVESVNGDVTIRFEGEVDAEFKVDSFNGDIDNCFGPEPQRTSRYAPGLELNFVQGSGAGNVEISTLNGDIDLCK